MSKFIREKPAPKKAPPSAAQALADFKPFLKDGPAPWRGYHEPHELTCTERRFFFDGEQVWLCIWRDGEMCPRLARHSDATDFPNTWRTFLIEMRELHPDHDYDPIGGWRDGPNRAFVRFATADGRVLIHMTRRTHNPHKPQHVSTRPVGPEAKEQFPRAWQSFVDGQGPGFRDPWAPEAPKPSYGSSCFANDGGANPLSNLDRGYATRDQQILDEAAEIERRKHIVATGGINALIADGLARKKQNTPYLD